VREVLFKDLYRGVITWNRTRKRNQWGLQQQRARPAADWFDVAAPELRIVSEDTWTAAHARLAAVRSLYLTTTDGQPFGRPPLGDPSKYLLTNLALCGCCGGSLRARSRSHGRGRKYFYGCSGYHERGRTVCANNADVPMTDANDILIEALLDDVLDETMLLEAVDEALQIIDSNVAIDRLPTLEAQLATVDQERERLVSAIAAGGPLDGLVHALQAREGQRIDLEAERVAIRAHQRVQAVDLARVRTELLDLAASWRQVLVNDPTHARPIVSSLLRRRVTIAPTPTKGQWVLTGEGHLIGLFERTVFPSGWRPQRDSDDSGQLSERV
jgi:hypothetical protein